jgi:hypothetical protein
VFTFVHRRAQDDERRRLARSVRGYAQAEREEYHRAGVLELGSVAARTALYEQIAERLEGTDGPLPAEPLERLRALIAEPPPIRDYGPRAEERNTRIAAILADLGER